MQFVWWLGGDWGLRVGGEEVAVCCDINNLIAAADLNAAGAPSDGYF